MKKIADWLNKNWVLKVVLSFLPSVWLPFVVPYLGTYIGVFNDDHKITAFGLILTIAIYLLSLVALLVSGYWASKDKEDQAKFEAKRKAIESTRDFYHQILSSLNICNANQNKTTIDEIPSICHSENLITSFQNLSKVKLSNLAQEIRACFHALTAIPQDKLIVTVAYSFDEKNWEWADAQAAKNGLPLEDLVSKTGTTFHEVLHSKNPIAYYNSKSSACEGGHYTYDQFDSRHNNVGSIVCWKIPIKLNDGTALATLVVSISSYGQCFEKGEVGSKTVRNSVQFLFDIFEELLAAELIDINLYKKILPEVTGQP